MKHTLRSQGHFLACLLDDSAPLPAGWDAKRAAGMTVYRNAYRNRLIEVLRNTYERTARLVGDDAFVQAAAHHLIKHPPTSWTIDWAGHGFAETCSELFANDPDVGEVAWLEWAMHCAFTAADRTPMTLRDFASASANFDADQWDGLSLQLTPGTALRQVTFDIAGLWTELAGSQQAPNVNKLDEPKWLLVWRDGELPVFGLISPTEGRALADIQRGTAFGEACARALDDIEASQAAAAAGAMLRNWIEIGLIETISFRSRSPAHDTHLNPPTAEAD